MFFFEKKTKINFLYSLTNVESEEEASDNDEDLPVLNFTHYTTNDDDEPSPPPAPSNTTQSHVDTSDDVVSPKEETKVSSEDWNIIKFFKF